MHGFTLAELMMVIAVVGILTAIALPNFRELIVQQRVKNASFDVFATLVFTRNEAVTRGATVTITPTSNNWGLGWTVTAADLTVVRRQDAYPTTITITGPSTISFNGMGRLTSGGAMLTPISLKAATGANASNSRCISLDLSGRPVTKTGDC